LERECWALWYGCGAIGIADELKAEIEAALNPCWGAADEALEAAREQVAELKKALRLCYDPLAIAVSYEESPPTIGVKLRHKDARKGYEAAHIEDLKSRVGERDEPPQK